MRPWGQAVHWSDCWRRMRGSFALVLTLGRRKLLVTCVPRLVHVTAAMLTRGLGLPLHKWLLPLFSLQPRRRRMRIKSRGLWKYFDAKTGRHELLCLRVCLLPSFKQTFDTAYSKVYKIKHTSFLPKHSMRKDCLVTEFALESGIVCKFWRKHSALVQVFQNRLIKMYHAAQTTGLFGVRWTQWNR